MSVLGEVFGSLRSMTQWQLLLAFLACIGYALGQGSLVTPKVRRIAWLVTVLSVLGYALESQQWTNAAMLVAFAIAGLGVFVASAWLISRLLGFASTRVVLDAADSETAGTPGATVPAALPLPPRGGPAHSV